MRKNRISMMKRSMRRVVLSVFLFCPLYLMGAQTISVKGQSLTVREAIKLIEQNSDYTFFYNAIDLKDAYRRNIDCNGSISEVLDEVLEGSGISYIIKDKEVILKAHVESKQQQQPKSGKIIGGVTDSKGGEPIPGASVRVKGTSRGTVTDIDGRFEIAASTGEVLEISFIGYVSKEIKVEKQKLIAVTLAEDAELLDEVVVTAFGTGQKKETVTGSIQSVRPTDLKVPTSNLSTAFAGRLSGVISYQRSGEPGNNGAEFFIRGVSTMNGTTSPLIVLDGVEISKGDLNALDPEVIESFSVLKDATASAMYGTRGANGVLIIKTKTGADLEKPIIGVRVEGYINTPIKRAKTADAITYMRMFNEAVTNQGTGDVLYSEEKINGTLNNLNPYVFPNVDWYKEIFKDATFNQKANFNIRGGTQKITYFMNVNASHETGMLKNRSKDFFSYDNNIDYWRYAFQNNIEFHLSKTSTISLNLNVQLKNMHGPLTATDDDKLDAIYNAIMGTNPVDFPVMYPRGDDRWYHWGGYMAGNYLPVNPVALASAGYKDTFDSTVMANLNWEQKLDFITEGLSFKGLFSFKNYSFNRKYRYQRYNQYQLKDYSRNEDGSYSFTDSPIGDPTNHTLDSFFGNNGDRRFYLQGYFNYERAFGDHNVSAMLLYNQDELNNNVNSDLKSSLPRRKVGFAFRASYDFKHRYMLEVNAGYNGSESFAKGHRWGFFPSVSLGWAVSEEKFWNPVKNIVPYFKIRGSYGLVGNDKIDDERFIYMSIVELTGDKNPSYHTGYGNQTESHTGPTFKRYENKDLTWEVGKKMNIGIDMDIFNSLRLTADVFKEIRSDIFQKKNSIPNYLGTANTVIYGNLAKVKNWGFEVAADYGKQFNKDLSVQFKGTFTFARNKVLEYDEGEGVRPAMSQIGRKLKGFLGYVADGLYIDEADIANSPTSTIGNIAIAPGDVKYVDQPDANGNYDGKITKEDMVEIGYPEIPEIIYGFGPSVTWKNWDFSVFFQGQANVSLMMKDFQPFGTQSKKNVLQFIADDYWSPENQNPNARYPRLTKYDNDHNTAASTYWLRNASFLKLKMAEVGYNFAWARVYISGANLLTFSPFKHWDPEMGGGAGMKYPTQRTFNLGVQFTFK